MTEFGKLTVTQLQAESSRLESRISEMERNLADLKADFGAVRKTLSDRLRPSPEPRISEHALLRFIERVYGVKVDEVRAEIMSPGIVAALKSGVTGITVKGVRMICKEGVIVTVVTEEMKNQGKQKRTHEHEESAA